MVDLWKQAWTNRVKALPRPEPLELFPVPNVDAEMLACVICGQGSDERGSPTEWLVTMSATDATVTRGLHESCRVKQVSRVKRQISEYVRSLSPVDAETVVHEGVDP
jgi:hypothetical protein